MSKDYYNILGVGKTASQEEIKNSFRKKAHQHHPDKGGDAEKFKELSEAYQVLGNPEKRQQYDRFGSAFNGASGQGFGGAGGFGGFQSGGINMDFEDLSDLFGGFGDIFGFGGRTGGSGRSQQSRRGRDLEMNLELDFMEAVTGLEKEISFSKNVSCSRCQAKGAEPGSKIETCSVCGGSGRVMSVQRTILGNIQTQTTCQHCSGEGKIFSQKCSRCQGAGVHRENVKIKVKIPAGIDNGEAIRLSGQGEAGQKGAPSGDLYLRVRLRAHKKFVRQGYDVKTEEVIGVGQAIMGDKIEVETVQGMVKLKIPEGTQSETVFKIKDKGLPHLHNRGLGDHYVKVKVKIPKGLSREQKQALGDLGI